MRDITTWLLQLLQLVTLVSANPGNWTKPNSQSPSFTDTYTINERIYVSWLSLNNSINDLWLTRYDTSVDDYAVRLEVAQNVSIPNSYEWTIAVSASEVLLDTRFVLQFLPTGSAYDPSIPAQLPSPPFNLITVNQLSAPNGTVGAPSITPSATTATSTQATISTSSLASESSVPGNAGPPTGKFIAIGVALGFALLAIGSAIGAFFAIKSYRRRNAPVVSRSDNPEKVVGPYEVLGTSRQPTELSSKETMIHELNSPAETMAEGKDYMVYELSSTKKQPGLHELPG